MQREAQATDNGEFWEAWRTALQAAGLPAERLFHDLRLLRYNIVTERETADALLRADAYLSTQPTSAESEKGQVEGHSPGRQREVVDRPERGWLLR